MSCEACHSIEWPREPERIEVRIGDGPALSAMLCVVCRTPLLFYVEHVQRMIQKVAADA